jgi:hypothetical protein
VRLAHELDNVSEMLPTLQNEDGIEVEQRFSEQQAMP